MEEERAAVHLDRPGQKAAEVVDIPGEREREQKEKDGVSRENAAELLMPSTELKSEKENVGNIKKKKKTFFLLVCR